MLKISLPPTRERIAKEYAETHGLSMEAIKCHILDKILDPEVEDIPAEMRRMDEIMSKAISSQKTNLGKSAGICPLHDKK